jgi:hypothetical protein
MLFGKRLAPTGQRLEGGHDVRVFLHPLPQARHIALNREPARPQQDACVALIPIHPIGLNDIVEHPALIIEALHAGLAMGEIIGCARKADAAEACRCGKRRGAQKLTTMHGLSPFRIQGALATPLPLILPDRQAIGEPAGKKGWANLAKTDFG